jgi:hypothetical protein
MKMSRLGPPVEKSARAEVVYDLLLCQQDIPHAISEVLLATPPRRAGHLEKTSNHSAKKRKSEEADEIVSQGTPNQATWRHKRSAPHSSKQMERPSRWFSGLTLDSTVGGAERYSLHLVSLISPIR